MKLIGFVLAAVVALAAGYADAADLKAAPLPVKAPVVPYVDMYSGFYIGGGFGYGWDRGNLGASFPTGPADFGDLSNSPQGFLGGGYMGVGTRLPSLFPTFGLDGYAGLEGSGWIGNLSGTAASPGLLTGMVATTNDHWFARAVGRFGLIYQNVMFFGDAGWAWGDTALNITTGAPIGVVPAGTNVGSNSMTQNGFTWGGGIEFPWFFGPNWKARFEYMQMDFGTNAACIITTCGTVAPILATQKDRIDAVIASVNYKF